MRSYSEQTARLVDAEIRRLAQEALDRARSVLRANRGLVEALAARLLATEVVEEPELVRILGTQGDCPRGGAGRAPGCDGRVGRLRFPGVVMASMRRPSER